MSNFEVIAKFGGTSVTRPDLVREHVENERPPVVVVSAPGVDRLREHDMKVTDMLVAYKFRECDGQDIYQRFAELTEEMSIEAGDIIDSIPRCLQVWYEYGVPVEALGERWTAQLYSRYLGKQYIDASRIIRTDENGQIDVAVSEQLIREQIVPGNSYVVPGFFGADQNGALRLMGRGTSDVTPALIARALGARECHIWSDVKGFMTSDPAVNYDAEMVSSLDYTRVLGMAEAGCQLLHPEVCHLLGNTAVKTVIRNTFGMPGNRGTEVVSSSMANSI